MPLVLSILAFALGLYVGTLAKRSTMRRVADEAYDRGFANGVGVGVAVAETVAEVEADEGRAVREVERGLAERN